MAEWLRRETWNLLGFSRAGSNPADYGTVRTYACRTSFLPTRNCNTSVELSLRGTCLHLKWRYWNSLLMKSFFNLDTFKRVLNGDFFPNESKTLVSNPTNINSNFISNLCHYSTWKSFLSLHIASGHHRVVKLNLLEDILNHSRSPPWALVLLRTWFNVKKWEPWVELIR